MTCSDSAVGTAQRFFSSQSTCSNVYEFALAVRYWEKTLNPAGFLPSSVLEGGASDDVSMDEDGGGGDDAGAVDALGFLSNRPSTATAKRSVKTMSFVKDFGTPKARSSGGVHGASTGAAARPATATGASRRRLL